MIKAMEKAFKANDRDIDALAYVLVALSFLLILRSVVLIYNESYQDLWPLLPMAIPLLSALLVVRVANRLIINGHMVREDERRKELVRTTHHLIAIATDLRQRVVYCEKLTKEGGRPTYVLIEIAKTIEDRYETLLNREGYSFLPSPCVDIIIRISGQIFGIGLLAQGLERGLSSTPTLALASISISASESVHQHFDSLIADLKLLVDELFKVRESVSGDSMVRECSTPAG